MTVMAVRFMEYGRVIFYLFIAVLSFEASAIFLMKLKKKQS